MYYRSCSPAVPILCWASLSSVDVSYLCRRGQNSSTACLLTWPPIETTLLCRHSVRRCSTSDIAPMAAKRHGLAKCQWPIRCFSVTRRYRLPTTTTNVWQRMTSYSSYSRSVVTLTLSRLIFGTLTTYDVWSILVAKRPRKPVGSTSSTSFLLIKLVTFFLLSLFILLLPDFSR